jgi:hypothetical protein
MGYLVDVEASKADVAEEVEFMCVAAVPVCRMLVCEMDRQK